jgi:hypothetical protein
LSEGGGGLGLTGEAEIGRGSLQMAEVSDDELRRLEMVVRERRKGGQGRGSRATYSRGDCVERWLGFGRGGDGRWRMLPCLPGSLARAKR